MDSVCGSTFWDLNVTWYTSNPELTECFEKTVLIWVPCLFLWSFAFLDVFYIRKSRTYHIPWSFLNVSKLLLLAFLIILELSNLITILVGNNYYLADKLSPLLKILSFCLAGVLIHYNRKYGIRTSGVLFLFWFFLLVCGIPQFKKEIEKVIFAEKNLDRAEISFFIYYVLVFLKFLLNLWTDKAPEKSDNPLSEKPCPSLSSSFISRITFHWFTFMVWKGYRKPLDSSDLWDLNYEDTSKEIVPIFDKYWQKAANKNQGQKEEPSALYKDNTNNIKFTHSSTEKKAKKKVSILPVLVKAYGLSYLIASLQELAGVILTFINPQILSLLIDFVNHKEEPWRGYLYVILLFGTSLIRTLLTNQYFYRLFTFGVRIRTALISAIYRKSLRMSSVAKKEKTVGEIVNLMSVDCQKFVELSFHLNLVWSAPLQIIIAMYFLWGLLGPSAIAGLAVMVMLVPCNSYIANKMKVYQIKQMKLKDERVKLMNEVLNGIKIIKLYAWEANFESQISKIRTKEVKLLKKSQLLHAFSTFIFSCAPFFVSLASFATFVLVDKNNVLDVQTAFVSLSLFNILRMPMYLLPNLISLLVQMSVSIKRINSFMNVEELDSDNVQHDPSEKLPLLIENGTFSWDEEPILKNINLRFLHGELVAVVGTIGSGKSTLLSAFLGETKKIRGRVNVLGSVAYVPQQAWIQNASLRDNILFGKPFDRVFYERVIDACSLRTDFDILPGGDQTEIGEKGINLSGGQKQRVSLARAVYSNADVYFLDDPLSAVDSHVGKHIFDNVLGPNGLLKNKTRVLVTHGATYLPDMDSIVVLKDGEVSEVGTYSELLEQKGAFADFLMQYVIEISQQGDNDELEVLQRQLSRSSVSEEVNKTISRHMSLPESDRSSLGRSKISLNKQMSIVSMQKQQSIKRESLSSDNKIKGQILIEKEFTEQGGVKLAIYKHYLKAVGIMLCSLTLFFNFTRESFNVGTNFILNLWSEDANAITNNGTVDTSTRDMYIALYGSLGTLQGFCAFATNAIRTIGCVRASIYVHNVLLKSVMHWPLSIFDVTPLGRILNRFASDIQTVDTTLPTNLEMILSQLLRALAIIVVITYTAPIFMAIIVPIGIMYVLIQRLYVATSRQLKRLESVSRSPIYSHFSETITGVATIRAYGVQQTFIRESEAKVDFNQVCFYPTNVSNRWLAVRLETIGNLVILFASLFAVLGNQSAGLVGLSISYALQITFNLNMLVRFSADLESNIVSVERIKEYEEAPKEAAWEITNRKPPRLWPENGNIEFKNYSTRYRTGLDLVLNKISFSIKGGEKVGIVGRTGAGKSSLTLALFRIVEPTEGEIIIDGVNISQIGLHDLRSRITIIPQEAILFSGSLRMNLDPFNEHSDEEIWDALELSHLKPFIKGLPAGLNHEISEGGDNLSMGQKQLVCLGRALLRKTKILVLDEATAAVDLETDDLIQETIRKEFKECTVLTIAHRLNTIMDYDRIMVLDKGQIAEFDSTKNLLENKNSIFYEMVVDAGLI